MFWRRYVPVEQRRRKAAREVAKLKKAGQNFDPVSVEGRAIATTFWGAAWCRNLESFSDVDNRLPRGRTYVRNGSVIDLQIEAGQVRALVSGSEIYRVDIAIEPLPPSRWKDIKLQCAGQIGSLVEFLDGSLSKGVMQVVTGGQKGLLPAPREIKLKCSCPDWARMCKHVAAALYGVGARLDHRPELLFTLRGVEPAEMVEAAAVPRLSAEPQTGRALECDDLSSVFGIDIECAETVTRPNQEKGAGKAPVGKAHLKVAAGKTPSGRRAPKTFEEQTLRAVKREGRVTTGMVMQRFGMPRTQARSMLERLAERGALRRVGERGRGVHYVSA